MSGRSRALGPETAGPTSRDGRRRRPLPVLPRDHRGCPPSRGPVRRRSARAVDWAVLAAADPRPGVPAIVDRAAGLPQLQRPERVDHDRELVEVVDPDRALVGAGLRAVRVAAGVQRDRALADARALASLVVAV